LGTKHEDLEKHLHSASGLDLRLLLFHAGECEQNNAPKAPGDTELCVQTDSPPTNENQSYRHIGSGPDEKYQSQVFCVCGLMPLLSVARAINLYSSFTAAFIYLMAFSSNEACRGMNRERLKTVLSSLGP